MSSAPSPSAPTSTAVTIEPAEARARFAEFTVVDVRTPGEFAGGHLPGARNVPLDLLPAALDELRAAGTPLLVVCASGARSATACRTLTGHGLTARSLSGGTSGWRRAGGELDRPAGTEGIRPPWAMDRQVRLTAGTLVLVGLAGGLLHPAALLLSAGVAGGLVLSALSDTCAMGSLLSRLPYNRR
ncbi:rhodanese-like domain-containing protein [Streptomyces sp. NPDC090025]|uniref:rhodanese-like domain-containing protein n=1 Tax=Streptomyces sp. NPDC090025 TaxID=3365922 RepID=UPI0038393F4D